MTISAISSNYSSYQTYEYQFFGATISDSQLEYLMQKYRITPTGDSLKDVEALYQAMYGEASSQATNLVSAQNTQNKPQTTEPQNSTKVPWADLMSKVGLAATGELAQDYTLFNAKLSAMQSSGATSPQDQALIGQLSAEASIVFVAPQQTSDPQNTTQTKSVSGADIVAQLNKLYFFS